MKPLFDIVEGLLKQININTELVLTLQDLSEAKHNSKCYNGDFTFIQHIVLKDEWGLLPRVSILSTYRWQCVLLVHFKSLTVCYNYFFRHERERKMQRNDVHDVSWVNVTFFLKY